MKDLWREKYFLLIVPSGLAVLGFVLVMAVTAPYGAVTSWDSACYFQAAASFSVGEGFMNYSRYGTPEVMTQYPPFYSVVLSAGRFLGLALPDWARVLDAAFFAMNILLMAGIAYYLTGLWHAAALAGACMFVFVDLVQAHTGVCTEPLFFVCMLAWWWSMMRYMEDKRFGMLLCAALFAGMGLMTRYAGVSMVLAGALVVVLTREKRFWCAAVYVALAMFVPALWFWRNVVMAGQIASFTPHFSWMSLMVLQEAVSLFAAYFLPGVVPQVVRDSLMIAFVAIFAVGVKRSLERRPSAARFIIGWQSAGIFAGAYVMTLVLAVLFSQGIIVLEKRYFLPLLIVLLVMVVVCYCFQPSSFRKKIWAGGFVLLMVIALTRTAQLCVRIYQDGGGYATRERLFSGVVRAVRSLPDNVMVYANDRNAFYIYTGRPAREIPWAWKDPASLLPLEETKEHFIRDGAVAVIFDGHRLEHPVWWQLVREIPLKVAVRDRGGMVYVASATGKGR